MRTRAAMVPLLAAAAVVLVAGCSSGSVGEPAPSSTRSGAPLPVPDLGGRSSRPHSPPTAAMDRLERPVHDRLAAQILGQGLTLDYLDCPHWDGSVPSRMRCRGYVDGLVARVAVHLEAAVEGRAVSFDARLLDGVMATQNLEATLRRQGWTEADCGDVAAYPARVGSTVVCHVERPSDDRYVVATVTDRSGAVMISDYRGAAPSS